ncbi:hypothetical protein PSQ19_12445 [Devosia algicola]|uniref:GGDEF domain-containing protein n=1 Tax=Devosia algicola TaxID=3026418 RepID=A0ABY7YKI4_9HYPH|nr:hypothetical protein [Devosia algicola]WDR01584.1 hypothetical protein PSQ19_12445 [Devosia algicola]
MFRRLKLPRLMSPSSPITLFIGLPESIKGPVTRISVVLSLLIILGVWQHDFVYRAAMSNIYLNLSIWGTFAFGVILVYRNLMRMRNEDLAFQALKEMHEDARNLNSGNVADPMWRHYRCNEPGRGV